MIFLVGSVNQPESIYSLPLLKLIKEAQQQHGLRHGDYQRYRTYCSRRLQRLRKVLHFGQGDKKSYKKKVQKLSSFYTCIVETMFIFRRM